MLYQATQGHSGAFLTELQITTRNFDIAGFSKYFYFFSILISEFQGKGRQRRGCGVRLWILRFDVIHKKVGPFKCGLRLPAVGRECGIQNLQGV